MINIAKLLKDAPVGMKLYSPLSGEVEFAEVMDTCYMPIRVMKRGRGLRFDKYGRYMGNEYPNSECLLFPSKDCRTCEGWKLPVQPKFKDGDKVVFGTLNETIAVVLINEQRYLCESCREILFDEQDKWQWHLAPKPHYDISNFHAGMPVLVRDNNGQEWNYLHFSHYRKKLPDHFFAGGNPWEQCIPFEGNEHLLGTTDMPSREYINW